MGQENMVSPFTFLIICFAFFVLENWAISKIPIKKKREKIHLQAGACAGRYSCENINKECCNDLPKEGEDFVECEYYKPI